MCRHGLDRSGSGWLQVAGTCECGNAPSGSIKCREFLALPCSMVYRAKGVKRKNKLCVSRIADEEHVSSYRIILTLNIPRAVL